MKTLSDSYYSYINHLVDENPDYFFIRTNRETVIYSLTPFTKEKLEQDKKTIIEKLSQKKLTKDSAIVYLKDIEKAIKNYDLNKKDNLHKVIDRKEYIEVINMFCKEAQEELLNSKTVSLGSKVGYLEIRQGTRYYSPDNLKVDWGETHKVKKELLSKGVKLKSKENPDGENYIRYFPYDGIYYCVHWQKTYNTPNITCYKYHVANSSSSNNSHLVNFKRKLIKAFKDPLAPLKFNKKYGNLQISKHK